MTDRLTGLARIAADAGLGAVFAVGLAIQAAAIAGSWGGGYWLFGSAAGVVVCVIALVRRRHRAGAAVAGLAVAAVAVVVAWVAQLPREPSPAMALGLSVLVGSAIRALPARSASAVAAAGATVVAAGLLVAFPFPSGVPAVPVLNGTAWLVALAVGLGLRLVDARRRATAEKVRRDERLAMTRELHDVAAHHITAIVVQAQAAQLVAHKYPEKLEGSLADIEAAASDALAAVRRVVGLMRDTDDAVPAPPGREQLSEMVRRFHGNGPAVHLRLPDGESTWPPDVTTTVYRVVQESLTNISRHAPHARSVTVDVARDRQAITVEVTDDGPSTPARYHQHRGYGLIGMRERVEAMGGTLRAGPRPGAGWSVLATLPVPAQGPR